MTLLRLNNIGHVYGGFPVFAGVHASIEPGMKIGLVGPNGMGKTTLLRILTGLEIPVFGTVERARTLKLGYLHQEAVEAFTSRTNSLMDEMLNVFAHVHTAEARMRDLEVAMGETDDLDAVMEEYGSLLEDFEAIGGYDFETRIEQTLDGLGFVPADYDTSVAQLSGGQKTRALLAKLLLENPDLLVMDEPTNHLDAEAVAWLESALLRWTGTLLVVSHDRAFLDSVPESIWELSRSGIETYRGNYTAYLRQRAERQTQAIKTYEATMEQLSAELDYIKRNIARASTNGQAVGRLRRLSRDLHAIHTLGLEPYLAARKWSETGVDTPRMYTVMEAEDALKSIPAPARPPAPMRISLDAERKPAEVTLRAKDLTIGYPGRVLFKIDTLSLRRGEVVALIGGNGAGKTTFLKTILGELPPLSGTVHFGQYVKVGYFAQAHNNLDHAKTVLDELMYHAEGVRDLKISEARAYLAKYLFRGETVYKEVGALSGGERGRLALAVLGLSGANLLLLDEPTNHLDVIAQEELQSALEGFEGTIVLVSHDRYLVERLATRIWEVKDGQIAMRAGSREIQLELS
ncbi:MAG: ABC-F family ATP-binding cassette domain-containing protein [Anaerolineae bacterium]